MRPSADLYLISQKKIPEVGEQYTYEDYRFKILNKHERRLDKVELRKIEINSDDNKESSTDDEKNLKPASYR